jgi:hypothetical protein
MKKYDFLTNIGILYLEGQPFSLINTTTNQCQYFQIKNLNIKLFHPSDIACCKTRVVQSACKMVLYRSKDTLVKDEKIYPHLVASCGIVSSSFEACLIDVTLLTLLCLRTAVGCFCSCSNGNGTLLQYAYIFVMYCLRSSFLKPPAR